MKQLDFPSISKGYRTSHAIANFLTQRNTMDEFNQRLQSKTSFRLVETHGLKLSESHFRFSTLQTTFLSGAANTILQANHKEARQQTSFLNK